MNVTLAGCQKNGKGQYIIPVELTFEGRAVTYTVLVEKRESVLVTLEHEQDVTVELTNNAGAVIAPGSRPAPPMCMPWFPATATPMSPPRTAISTPPPP